MNMYKHGLKCYAFLLLCFVFISVIILQFSLNNDLLQVADPVVVVWWTPFITHSRTRTCGRDVCIFTSDRSFKFDNVKAYLFYGSAINLSDLPLPRGQEIWALFHEESPRNVPVLSHEPVLSLFNFSSTFSRHSDIPLTLQYLRSLESVTSKNHFKSFKQKTEFLNELAPVIYLQSDCSTPNNRDSYVEELMRYIQIDSYGECLNNKKLPESLNDRMNTMMSDELMEVVSKYMFSIAFENAICDDYITEKLWRPIIAGSIPIYSGSPSVENWLPNNNTVIHIKDFKSPKDLASYLQNLKKNEEEYMKYLNHKSQSLINNVNLTKAQRNFWPEIGIGIIEEFECFVCTNTWRGVKKVVTRKHYDCPEPVSIVDLLSNSSNWWHIDYKYSACKAVAFREFVETYDKEANNNFYHDPSPNC